MKTAPTPEQEDTIRRKLFALNAAFADIEACIEADNPRECLAHVKRSLSLTAEVSEAANGCGVPLESKLGRQFTDTLTRARMICARVTDKTNKEKEGKSK